MSISNLYAPPVSILVRSRPLRPRRDHALASSPLPLPCGPHSAPILIHMPLVLVRDFASTDEHVA